MNQVSLADKKLMGPILVLDDDLITHTLLKSLLKDDFSIVSCFSIAEAHLYFDSGERPCLAIIDRVLPDGDGISVCSRLRSESTLKTVPIILLSNLNTESDKVSGLFAGADDYVTKPFSPLEMKARVLARLRAEQKTLVYGKLSIDLFSHRTFIQKPEGLVEIDLTRREFKLLSALLTQPDRMFSREDLLSRAWGENTNVGDRVVDTSISHLRKKLEGSGLKIEALRGEGYRLINLLKPQAA